MTSTNYVCSNDLLTYTRKDNWRPCCIFLRNFQASSNFIPRFNPFLSMIIDLSIFFFEEEDDPSLMTSTNIIVNKYNQKY